MQRATRTAFALFATSIVLTACGGGDHDAEAPLNTDYSALRVAQSREGALVQAANTDALLDPLKNGVRMSLDPGPVPASAGLNAPLANGESTFSRTTVQVDGVDEADLLKYDGRYMYIVKPEAVPASLTLPVPGMTRNVLKIVKTNTQDATLEVASEFTIPGEQSTLPQIYQLQTASGETEFIAAVSQNYQGWMLPQPHVTSLVVQPDRTKLQLIDVRDAYNVGQAWEVELDGWLRASRKIGDTLYLVNSYRPRLTGLQLPAETQKQREANERRVRTATAVDLLPKARINGGSQQALANASDCVVAADLQANEAYTDLVVITAVDLRQRRIADVACVSTNINGVYVSKNSIYVGGEGTATTPNGAVSTVLHKFALAEGNVAYRASGTVGGRLGWANAAYFMDEHDERLRVVTSQTAANGHELHRLSILEETSNQKLALLSILPSQAHPEPLGKPGEQIHAVRFHGDRGYVVTARITDPLYVLDLSDAHEPFIAGSLELPGFSTYLKPLDAEQRLLLAIGRQTDAAGVPQGVKLELFDVARLDQPKLLATRQFGEAGSWSDAVSEPHALAVLSVDKRHRIALPIDVFATPHPIQTNRFLWTYSGVHLLEVDAGVATPTLRYQGVIKTEESSDPSSYPRYAFPRRNVLHGDSVFGVHGDGFIASKWDAVRP